MRYKSAIFCIVAVLLLKDAAMTILAEWNTSKNLILASAASASADKNYF